MISIIKKWKTMPDGAKAAIAFTFSSLVIKGISFVTTPIFTRIMDTTQNGIVQVFNSWNSILEVFALLGLTSAGVFNAGLNDYRDNRDGYISSILVLCNISTLITFIVICVAQNIANKELILSTSLLIPMFLQFLFNPAQIFLITRHRYEYKYKIATIISILSSCLSQIVAIVCIQFYKTNHPASTKIWSCCIVYLCFSIPIYIYLLVKGKHPFNKIIWKQTLIFALPLIPHYLSQHIMSASDRIMIASIISESDAAIYAISSTISYIATVIWGAIQASLTPYIYNKLNDNKYKEITNIVSALLIAYSIVCVSVSLIAPEVLMILGPKEYSSGVYNIPPIAATAFISALYNIYATIEFYHKKSSGIATATIIATVINLGLNYLLIPKFGFVAAAYTTLVSYIVLVLMHYWNYRRCQSDRTYNDKFILCIAVFTTGFCLICNLLYSNVILRYVLITVIVFICILKRKFIIDKINTLRNK